MPAVRANFPPVVVHSHARSGSTLLYELLGQDPQVWTAYEPLQDVRQIGRGVSTTARCRSADYGGGDPLNARCPMRDAALLVALLSCDPLPLLTAWYADFELDGQQGGFVPHFAPPGPGSVWASTTLFPNMASTRAAQYRAQARACRARPGHLLKTVRMNGQLQTLYNISRALNRKLPVVLQLVRKPRSVYASRKNLSNPFGLPPAALVACGGRGGSPSCHEVRRSQLRDWAMSTCTATRRDIAAGRRFGGGAYQLVTFGELLRRPRQLVERIYANHFHRAVPAEVYAYIQSHLQPNESAVESGEWQFKYGTSARNLDKVEQRWREQLEPWELQEIDAACGKLSEAGEAVKTGSIEQPAVSQRQVGRHVGRAHSGKTKKAGFMQQPTVSQRQGGEAVQTRPRMLAQLRGRKDRWLRVDMQPRVGQRPKNYFAV